MYSANNVIIMWDPMYIYLEQLRLNTKHKVMNYNML